jgi:hypothetical protein
MTFPRCVPEDMRAELSEMHSFFSSSQQLNAHAPHCSLSSWRTPTKTANSRPL